jgi:hypothetical protein
MSIQYVFKMNAQTLPVPVIVGSRVTLQGIVESFTSVGSLAQVTTLLTTGNIVVINASDAMSPESQGACINAVGKPYGLGDYISIGGTISTLVEVGTGEVATATVVVASGKVLTVTASAQYVASTINIAGPQPNTPTLGLSTFDMTAALANNMTTIDTNAASTAAAITVINLAIANLPPTAWKNLTGDLTETQVIPWDGPTVETKDTGISRLAAGSLAIGNGTAGNVSGSLSCGSATLAPTGTGVALSVTGDANGSDIQDWYVNGATGSNMVALQANGNISGGAVLILTDANGNYATIAAPWTDSNSHSHEPGIGISSPNTLPYGCNSFLGTFGLSLSDPNGNVWHAGVNNVSSTFLIVNVGDTGNGPNLNGSPSMVVVGDGTNDLAQFYPVAVDNWIPTTPPVVRIDNNGKLYTTALQMNASTAAPTSAATAGTAGQLIYHGSLLYLCTVTGLAGSATWTKVTVVLV